MEKETLLLPSEEKMINELSKAGFQISYRAFVVVNENGALSEGSISDYYKRYCLAQLP